jgi:hypothetical protein
VHDWLKANGGPLAVVVLGLGLAGFTTPLGWVLVGLGISAMIWQRLPWEIRRKDRALSSDIPPAAEPKEGTPSWQELNDARVERYEHNLGLFVVHTWRPSRREGQVADVTIWLWKHPDGRLTPGEVRAVEYILGPKFTDHSRVITDARNAFAIEESMWAPMLCLAKVYLAGNREPLLLERYINFEGAEPRDVTNWRAPTAEARAQPEAE